MALTFLAVQPMLEASLLLIPMILVLVLYGKLFKNASSGDTINFNLTYPATNTLISGQLTIGKNITINVPGADKLTINGNDANRVFFIAEGVNVTLWC